MAAAGVRTPTCIDLHAHSDVSDGTEPPAVLVARAAAAGLAVMAITDHDTTAGWAQALAAGREHGVHVVPGIELSAELDGIAVHLLGYWPDPADEVLVRTLAGLGDSREDRARRTLAVLGEHGIDVRLDDVRREAGAGTPIGRPHLADALVRAGVVHDRAQAFDEWLGEGRPAYLRKQAPPGLADAVRLLRSAGGVPVLAHPWGRGSRAALGEAVLADMAAAGLAGIEVDHVEHDQVDRARLSAIAQRLGLLATGGSDDHGTRGKGEARLGSNCTPASVYRALRSTARDPAARESAG